MKLSHRCMDAVRAVFPEHLSYPCSVRMHSSGSVSMEMFDQPYCGGSPLGTYTIQVSGTNAYSAVGAAAAYEGMVQALLWGKLVRIMNVDGTSNIFNVYVYNK